MEVYNGSGLNAIWACSPWSARCIILAPLLIIALLIAAAPPRPDLVGLAFKDGEPLGAFKDIVTKLGEPANDEGATVSAEQFRALLADARVAKELYRKELIKYATPQSVKIQNAAHRSYLKLFLREENLKKGVEFLTAHKDELDRAEARFAVKREDIVSVLMWESNLGHITGKYLVFNTYLGEILFLDEVFAELEKKQGTLSPEPVREQHLKRLARLKQNAANFLIALLRSAAAKKVDPLDIRGSWAGAIGFPQFMPTSMRYAVDGDGDSKIDLYSFPDAIFSIGSYLEAHGYKDDRGAAIYAYNADSEYVNGVQAYADAIIKRIPAATPATKTEPTR